MSDIEFLYECIDEENDYRHESFATMQREPSLHELKEERRKLESDLMSATGRNQLHISTLPNEVSRQNHNRSIHSPVLNTSTKTRSRRVTPSPPSSAQSTTRQRQQSPKPPSPQTTIKNILNTTTAATPSQSSRPSVVGGVTSKPRTPLVVKPVSPVIKSTSNPPSSITNKISAVNNGINSKPTPTKTKTTTNAIDSTGSSLSNENKSPTSRPDSVDDSSLESSSVSSLSSSSHRVNSAQKFRQMVFEWRD